MAYSYTLLTGINLYAESFHCSRDGKYLLLGHEGWPNRALWLSTDYAASWTETLIIDAAPVSSCISLDGQHMVSGWRNYQGGNLYQIQYTNNGGIGWAGVNPQGVWAGNGGNSSNYTCYGLTSSNDGSIVYGFFTTANLNIGELYKSTDYGASWSLVNSFPGFNIWYYYQNIECSTDGNIVVVGGKGYKVAYSENGGTTWTTFTDTNNVRGVTTNSAGTILYMTRETGMGSWIRTSSNDNVSWANIGDNHGVGAIEIVTSEDGVNIACENKYSRDGGDTTIHYADEQILYLNSYAKMCAAKNCDIVYLVGNLSNNGNSNIIKLEWQYPVPDSFLFRKRPKWFFVKPSHQILFKDTFTDSDGVYLQDHIPDIGTGWTVTDGEGMPQIYLNEAALSDNNATSGTRTQDIIGPNGYIQAKLTLMSPRRLYIGKSANDGTEFIGLRLQSDECYIVYMANGIGWSDTILWTRGSAPTEGKTYKLIYNGSSIKAYEDDVEIASINDASGQGSMYGLIATVNDTGYTSIDDFEAGIV